MTDRPTDPAAALAALAWQIDLGAAEAIGDRPVNRYLTGDAAATPPGARPAAGASVVSTRGAAAAPGPARSVDPAAAAAAAVAAARAAAAAAGTLADLRAALASYEHCELKLGARSLVFADGRPGARVLVLGEAPGREEDIEGRPFVGRAGQLLDRMFAVIGLARDQPDLARALYITNVMPWRPPQNRDPTGAEVAMMLPFVERHIELADPQVIVAMGNTPLLALFGHKGITRVRGTWAQALGRPVLPMFHPAYLLREPILKREAWADLLTLQDRLRS